MLYDKYLKAAVYGQIENVEEVFEHPYIDKRAYELIYARFKSRCKQNLFSIETGDEVINMNAHSAHAISVYLLGITLMDVISSPLQRKLRGFIHLDKDEKFRYPWLLCALYHDVFTAFERNMKVQKEDFALEHALGRFDIDYDIYDRFPRHMYKNRLHSTYTEDVINRYYSFCFEHIEKYEHGILSGYCAFDRLVKNFEKHKQNHEHEVSWIEDGVRWDERQIHVFALVSDAIIAHNIWHNESYNIDQLNPKNPEQNILLTKRDNPLAFFLSLIDTIEPIKIADKIGSSLEPVGSE